MLAIHIYTLLLLIVAFRCSLNLAAGFVYTPDALIAHTQNLIESTPQPLVTEMRQFYHRRHYRKRPDVENQRRTPPAFVVKSNELKISTNRETTDDQVEHSVSSSQDTVPTYAQPQLHVSFTPKHSDYHRRHYEQKRHRMHQRHHRKFAGNHRVQLRFPGEPVYSYRPRSKFAKRSNLRKHVERTRFANDVHANDMLAKNTDRDSRVENSEVYPTFGLANDSNNETAPRFNSPFLATDYVEKENKIIPHTTTTTNAPATATTCTITIVMLNKDHSIDYSVRNNSLASRDSSNSFVVNEELLRPANYDTSNKILHKLRKNLQQVVHQPQIQRYFAKKQLFNRRLRKAQYSALPRAPMAVHTKADTGQPVEASAAPQTQSEQKPNARQSLENLQNHFFAQSPGKIQSAQQFSYQGTTQTYAPSQRRVTFNNTANDRIDNPTASLSTAANTGGFSDRFFVPQFSTTSSQPFSNAVGSQTYNTDNIDATTNKNFGNLVML